MSAGPSARAQRGASEGGIVGRHGGVHLVAEGDTRLPTEVGPRLLSVVAAAGGGGAHPSLLRGGFLWALRSNWSFQAFALGQLVALLPPVKPGEAREDLHTHREVTLLFLVPF